VKLAHLIFNPLINKFICIGVIHSYEIIFAMSFHATAHAKFDLDRSSSRNKDHDKANKKDQALIFAFIALKLNQISVIAFRFVFDLEQTENLSAVVQNFAKRKMWFKSKNANLCC